MLLRVHSPFLFYHIYKTGNLEDWEKAHADWLAHLADLQKKFPLSYAKSQEIKPQQVVELIYELTKDKYPIIATEVGQHQMWSAQYYLYDKPRRFISSGGLGVMGFGLPAAMGAQVGMPDRLVIGIAGDGDGRE